ncbi:hypothetical protein ACFQY4_06515 [Catellatospora bangladeshensis]|uniref:Uncharacterized protein n=1 Tax=Catellatospora bangladeshensis TaxID=310355 RepID=A0A8J3JWS7_9ACTN|nr:hypothetical protein [Catellatospora bangladeshensis]GIF85114.1 hypothetical protein Cba03nite_64630 [Catellatospora bangladeshensis]
MADVVADPWRLVAPAQAVADSLGTSYVSVEESRWATWQPNLPAEVTAFLAEPVVVGASPAGLLVSGRR